MEEKQPGKKKRLWATHSLMEWTSIFIIGLILFLYALNTTERLDPLKGATVYLRLEPVILIVLGFCLNWAFSRNVAQVLHNNLKHQTQVAEAAMFASTRAQIELEKMEEKCRNVSTVLKLATVADGKDSENTGHNLLQTAVNILES